MTELEKLDAGLEYDFWDEGVNARKLNAIEICAKLNALPATEEAARERAIRELFGAAGAIPRCCPRSAATTERTSAWGKTSSRTTT